MGAADVVPGVSGGTIALIAGIYDRLVGAIAELDPRPLRYLLCPHDPTARAGFANAWRRMDLTFLLVLASGMATAVVVLSQLVPIALEAERAATGAFFVGLIAASVVLIGRDVPWTALRAAIAAVAAAVVVAVATATGTAADPSIVLVFLAGAIAISAMLLPGLSGALLLLVLGQYEYMLGRLDALVGAATDVPSGGPIGELAAPGAVVVVFLSGAVVGVLSMGRAVDYALERARATTIAALVGLMAGGLYPPGRMAASDGAGSASAVAVLVGIGIVGAAVVTAFDWATDDLDYV